MPNIGPMELAVVLIIALVILGPKRLPGASRSLGRGIREFKNSLSFGDRDSEDATAVGERSQARGQQTTADGSRVR